MNEQDIEMINSIKRLKIRKRTTQKVLEWIKEFKNEQEEIPNKEFLKQIGSVYQHEFPKWLKAFLFMEIQGYKPNTEDNHKRYVINTVNIPVLEKAIRTKMKIKLIYEEI